MVKELLRLPGETAKHSAAISRIATKRRELAGRLGEAIGPTKAAQKLGVSRQDVLADLEPRSGQGDQEAVEDERPRAHPLNLRHRSDGRRGTSVIDS